MVITKEMEKMLIILKEHDEALRKHNDTYGHHFAPDIPDEVLKKLLKHWDKHLPINSIVAVYDTTAFSTWKGGYIFTNDGFYHKYIGKATYFRYQDIAYVTSEAENKLALIADNYEEPWYRIMSVFNTTELVAILEGLIAVDDKYGSSSQKVTGKVDNKSKLPDKMKKKCHAIIHAASVTAGGVGTGMAQIPCSDTAVITPIQIGMIVGLGKVFDMEITESAAKSILSSVGAAFTGRAVSQALVGWIPVAGNIINTATAAGLTEFIGWVVATDFYSKWSNGESRLQGMKDGFIEASDMYERKLCEQANEFLNQMKDIKREKAEYEKLLDEYEALIKKLQKDKKSEVKADAVQQVYDNLKGLKSSKRRFW